MEYTTVSVKVFASVPGKTEVAGTISMEVRKDEPTDTFLGFARALRLYAQGHTPQETERMMERCAGLYLQLAIQEGELEKILLHRGYRRLPPGPRSAPGPVHILTVRSISGKTEHSDPDESGMELEFAGA